MTTRRRITHDTEIAPGVTLGPVTRIVAPPGSTPGDVVTVDSDGETLILAEPQGGGGTNGGTPPVAIAFQWLGDATSGDHEGVQAVHVPSHIQPIGWKAESMNASGALEPCSAEWSVSARLPGGGSLVNLVGSGTAPALSSASLASEDSLDWDGGIIEQYGTLVVKPVSHTPDDATSLVFTLFGERTVEPVDPYSYAVFLTSDDFVVPVGVTEVDALLVAGGGGGGGRPTSNGNGGGGAGGVLEALAISVTPEDTMPVVVGGGGAGGFNSKGGKGGDSTFGGATAEGGGGGQGYTGSVLDPTTGGEDGGSGGGGCGISSGTVAGGSGTAGQGHDGGSGSVAQANQPAGGGGGASEAGQSTSGNTAGGKGGDGLTLTSLGWVGAIAHGAPSAVGGGGGGGRNGGTAGVGGIGGGGDGASNGNGGAGGANTGGGGGGDGGTSSNGGGPGGSGLVVVRWIEP